MLYLKYFLPSAPISSQEFYEVKIFSTYFIGGKQGVKVSKWGHALFIQLKRKKPTMSTIIGMVLLLTQSTVHP